MSRTFSNRVAPTANLAVLLACADENYVAWCKSMDDVSDLDKCIEACHQVLQYPWISQSSVVNALHLSGKAFCSRGVFIGQLSDIDKGMEELHSALSEAMGLLHASISLLQDLASVFYARWDLIGELEDLHLSIRLRRLALSESLNTESDIRLASMRTLSTALFLRFAHFPRIRDLDEVLHFDNQILLEGDGKASAARFGDLCTLAQSTLVKWDYDGDKEHIERSVSLFRDAISMSETVCAADYAAALNCLSEAIQSRVHLTEEDLEECIALDTKALQILPRDHLERHLALAAMTTSLLARFTIRNDRKDWATLEELRQELEAIIGASSFSYAGKPFHDGAWVYFHRLGYHDGRYVNTALFRQAIYLRIGEYEPARAIYVSRYGSQLFLRRFSDPGTNDSALLRRIMELSETTLSPRERSFHNAAIAYICRGKLDFGLPSTMQRMGKTIPIYRQWLDDLPFDDSWRYAVHINLAEDLGSEYWRLEESDPMRAIELLYEAIENYQKAVDLQVAYSHPLAYRTMAWMANECNTLAQNHSDALVENGSYSLRSVVDRAVEYSQQSLMLTPMGYQREVRIAADALIIRYKIWRQPADLDQAIVLFRRGVQDDTEMPLIRFEIADAWVDVAKELGHESQLDAYIAHLDLLVLSQGDYYNLSMVGRSIGQLGRAEHLASATEYCIEQGLLETAIDLLGRGRGIIWSRQLELLGLHLNDLTIAAPNEVEKLRMVLEAAENDRAIPTTAEGGPGHGLEYYDKPKLPWLNNWRRTQRLVADVKRLMAKARRKAGVGDPPMPSTSFIQKMPENSFPIVLLNAAVHRCDALIVRGRDLAVQHVSLPQCSRVYLDSLVFKMQDLLREGGRMSRSTRHFVIQPPRRYVGPSMDPLQEVLAATWRAIVGPVIAALEIQPTMSPGRLWWYPTGPFWQLPLHAAGIYSGTDMVSVQDYVVSSYLPAFNPTQAPAASSDKRLNVLAVHQAEMPGYAELPDTIKEVEAIEVIVKSVPSSTFTAFGGSSATVSEITAALPAANIVHFAQHGQQDLEFPIESCLLLSDGRLKVSQLINMHLPNAQLVFLSACETATGDKNLPGEVIHLAAAMLFVGFKSAIGTMWRITDCDGPPVAEETYRYLLNQDRFDPQDAAYALHLAVRKLRERNVPPIRWVPFIHLGV